MHTKVPWVQKQNIIEWLQRRALKRCLSLTSTTFFYVAFALKQNRRIPVIPCFQADSQTWKH